MDGRGEREKKKKKQQEVKKKKIYIAAEPVSSETDKHKNQKRFLFSHLLRIKCVALYSRVQFVLHIGFFIFLQDGGISFLEKKQQQKTYFLLAF